MTITFSLKIFFQGFLWSLYYFKVTSVAKTGLNLFPLEDQFLFLEITPILYLSEEKSCLISFELVVVSSKREATGWGFSSAWPASWGVLWGEFAALRGPERPPLWDVGVRGSFASILRSPSLRWRAWGRNRLVVSESVRRGGQRVCL